MTISTSAGRLWWVLVGTACTPQYAGTTPDNLTLAFHCSLDTCVINNKVNAVVFRVTNDSDHDVWLHAWSLSPYQLRDEDGQDVPQIRMREAKTPPIPEYLLVKKHSVVSYRCPSELFADYRLVPGSTYVLRCRYGEMARAKQDSIPTYLTETAVPSTRFTACN